MRKNQEGFKKAEIILQYMRKELNDVQEQQLFEWLDGDAENKAFFDKIVTEEGLREELSFFAETNKVAAWNEFEESIESEESTRTWKWMAAFKYIAAAAILMLVCFTIFFAEKEIPKNLNNASYKNDVKPGENKAILTLANGKEISLDEAANGTLAKEDNVIISKNAAGQVVYDQDASANIKSNAYNTITTPRAGDYMLLLPDGTRVWLNAASSIRFPVSFAADERKVVLKGEAYFEVFKNKVAPFKVMVDETEIKVLGTHFNVMAYPDEPAIKTTLIEGSVKVSKNKLEAILKPGQQVVIGDDIKVSPGSTEAVAWKDGFTTFKDADLETIMRSVSRWYDIEVRYQGQLKQKLFTGSVSRGANLSEVLNSLQYLGGVHFKIEGKLVTISAK